MTPPTDKTAQTGPAKASPAGDTPSKELESVTIRFAGDSGDGIQLTGTQFTDTTALAGNDISTLPDFPAEIRAPAGTLPGVSAFQLHFSSRDIMTPGDRPGVLVAYNPAALKVHLKDLEAGGILIVNTDAFSAQNLQKAGFKENPLDDGSLTDYRVIKVPLTKLTRDALEGLGLKPTQQDRCKNFYALGITYWIFERSLEPTLRWLESKFGKSPEILEANVRALKAGYNYANTTEIFSHHYRVKKAPIAPGVYRKITGNQATAFGFAASAQLARRTLYYCSYPITPASDILHELARYKKFGVRSFQAEDEIAAVCAAIGVSFAGQLGITGTSGPGVALKSEAIGLAVMAELPLVIVAVQRGGPSTGLPTKTEQADLLQALYGRNGECPVAVVAPATPSECFTYAIEAARLALRHMVPVFFLSDGYLANGAEPWKIPDLSKFEPIEIPDPAKKDDKFLPYLRDPKTLARAWAPPGLAGFEHRVGGLEKWDVTGNVSYDPDNHERMIEIRQEKVEKIADFLPPTKVHGADEGDLLVVGWGGTYGAITTAVNRAREEGLEVASVHLRHLNPLPKDLGQVLKRFKKVLVPELNKGQLRLLLRARYLVDAIGLNKVKGQPFMVSEIHEKIRQELGR